MKRKNYIQPEVLVVRCQPLTIICGSGVESEEKQIDYGGIDEDGNLTPGTRRYNDCWQEEDEEEERDEYGW